MSLSFDEYTRRDYRVKCLGCRRWMRWHSSSHPRRRRAPHAAYCTTCPVKDKRTFDPLLATLINKGDPP